MVELSIRDAELKRRLQALADIDAEYWSFRSDSDREYTHAFFQYPAMMVPQMQRKLIECSRAVLPGLSTVFDPFVGSGTTLAESMFHGLNFTGQDINPLAILICRAKAGPFRIEELQAKTADILSIAERDDSTNIEADFTNLEKWFRPDVALELSRIRRAIRTDDELWSRRFFWVALAETVRITSNSRTSTFKLHIRTKNEVVQRELSPLRRFREITAANLNSFREQRQLLLSKRVLQSEAYQGCIHLNLGDVIHLESGCSLPQHDLLLTSPPYGDNRTTVPYGQHAYLPLQWIDLADIDENLDASCLKTTHEIDYQSLGGSRRDALSASKKLNEVSPTFARTLAELNNEPPDRAKRVAAFIRDLNKSLDPILSVLSPHAYMIWTVGNRRVGGRQIPTEQILCELLSSRGAQHIMTIPRTIPTKRMAVRNSIAETMISESILIMRKD